MRYVAIAIFSGLLGYLAAVVSAWLGAPLWLQLTLQIIVCWEVTTRLIKAWAKAERD